jgi:predicted amidophosphoribosyltransferase
MSKTPTPPLCPDCREAMKLIKTISHVAGLPELFVFYCASCKQAETKMQDQAAA